MTFSGHFLLASHRVDGSPSNMEKWRINKLDSLKQLYFCGAIHSGSMPWCFLCGSKTKTDKSPAFLAVQQPSVRTGQLSNENQVDCLPKQKAISMAIADERLGP